MQVFQLKLKQASVVLRVAPKELQNQAALRLALKRVDHEHPPFKRGTGFWQVRKPRRKHWARNPK